MKKPRFQIYPNDLTGTHFGRLTVINAVVVEGPRPRGSSPVVWLCRCVCGNERTYHRRNLITPGNTVSCGCHRIDVQRARRTKHGAASRSDPVYNAWSNMHARCTNPNLPRYPSYGGRGVKVCDRWKVFVDFREDMGPKPSARHSIERINNDGDYEPANCRWATPYEQAQNRRPKVGKSNPTADSENAG